MFDFLLPYLFFKRYIFLYRVLYLVPSQQSFPLNDSDLAEIEFDDLILMSQCRKSDSAFYRALHLLLATGKFIPVWNVWSIFSNIGTTLILFIMFIVFFLYFIKSISQKGRTESYKTIYLVLKFLRFSLIVFEKM